MIGRGSERCCCCVGPSYYCEEAVENARMVSRVPVFRPSCTASSTADNLNWGSCGVVCARRGRDAKCASSGVSNYNILHNIATVSQVMGKGGGKLVFNWSGARKCDSGLGAKRRRIRYNTNTCMQWKLRAIGRFPNLYMYVMPVRRYPSLARN